MHTRTDRKPPRRGQKERAVAMSPRRQNLGAKGARGNDDNPIASTSGINRRGRRPNQRQQPRGKRQSAASLPDTQQERQGAKQSKHLPQNQVCQRSMRMTDWLKQLLESNEVHGLHWEDRGRKIFSISWIHKSNQAFKESTDGDIFFRWAEFRGQTATDPTLLKANFRCALNSLKDVEQLTREGAKRGPDAKRTFRFLSPSDPKYGKNRKKAKTSTTEKHKGKKAKKSVAVRGRSSQTSSRSSSWTSALDSSSSSAPSSPCASGDFARSPGFINSPAQGMSLATSVLTTSEKFVPLMEVECASTPQVEWTANYLQPVTGHTYTTNAKGITSVNICDVVSVQAKEESQAAEPSTLSVRDPQLQSGADISCLPNFSELGVPDTYVSEQVPTNTKLGCGGNVKVREKKPYSLPIMIDIYPVSEQLPETCTHQTQEGRMMSFSPGDAHQESYTLDQTDLDVGQTLEVSDETSPSQEASSDIYYTFTPPEIEILKVPTTEDEVKSSLEADSLQPAVRAALATLNETNDTIGPHQDYLTEQDNTQHITDELFAQTEEDIQDLFEMGTI